MSQTDVRDGATATGDAKMFKRHRRTQSSVGNELKVSSSYAGLDLKFT